MTYLDIYNNFMIEYDKANVSSSYPSFTEYEICTFLDKAYLAVIALKVGHSPSLSMLIELDPKSILELGHLICSQECHVLDGALDIAENAIRVERTKFAEDFNFLYILPSSAIIMYLTFDNEGNEVEHTAYKGNVKIVSRETAQKSFVTSSNYPKLKCPLLCLNEYAHGLDNAILVVDPHVAEKFFSDPLLSYVLINYIMLPESFKNNDGELRANSIFPGSSKLASEIVSTAVIMALENIESPRMQTKAQLKQLEA